MVKLAQLVDYLDTLLEVEQIEDYCPNGLQIEGRDDVERLVCGVTASQQLIDHAIAVNAAAILVHHGYFWKGESARITGIKRKRIGALLANNISLLGYHLPLDLHPVYGNNVQLARVLDWQPDPVSEGTRPPLLRTASLERDWQGDELAGHLSARLQRTPLHIPAPRSIRRVAWCTGGAQGYIEQAVELGVDAYVTGEVSEQTVHVARENGIHFFAAGHHATERYGAKALGEHVAAKFAVECEFVDLDNPA